MGKKPEVNPINSDEIISKGTIYERIRLVLEELGPTFVKLGQTFSNREDLLPAELIQELQKLQDRVEVVDMNVEEILENERKVNRAVAKLYRLTPAEITLIENY